jgi:hypothetical protein
MAAGSFVVRLPRLGEPCLVCRKPVKDVLQFAWCQACGAAMHFVCQFSPSGEDDEWQHSEICPRCKS